MKQLSEDSMVSIECGGVWALFTSYDCEQCALGITTAAAGAYAFALLVAELGIVTVIGLLTGAVSDPTNSDLIVDVVNEFGDAFSHCGPCWQQIKE